MYLKVKDFDITISSDEDVKHFYVYPSVRRGPVSVEKAVRMLGWRPSPWRDVLATTVAFYETAMTRDDFYRQRDEIVQIVTSQLYGDVDRRHYKAIEKLYGVDLSNFRTRHTEL